MTQLPQSTGFKVGKLFLQPPARGWSGMDTCAALTENESKKEKEKQKAVPAVEFLYLCWHFLFSSVWWPACLSLKYLHS